MRKMVTFFFAVWMTAAVAAAQSGGTLDIYFVDVEGGQATLIVTPEHQSLLVDAGWPGYDSRDAKRIAAAAKLAGISRIDYHVATHYHRDHVGGTPELAKLLPVGTFVDHGPTVESAPASQELYKAWVAERDKAKHLQVKPGDSIPLKGAEIRVVAAGGELLSKPLPGAGAQNPLCAGTPRRDTDATENARSVGFVLTFGKFRFIDLGDLTWNKELDLICPVNRIGSVDVYLTTHHGMNMSGPAAIVHALHPRVAIMNNGATKGGSPEAYEAVKSSPGLEDIWQLHRAIKSDAAHNAPEGRLANIEDQEGHEGHWLKLSAKKDGSFTVMNSRNNESKTYAAKSK